MRVIVVGGSKGIGYAIFRACHERGDRVSILARSCPEHPPGLVQHFVKTDLSCGEQHIRESVHEAIDWLGGLDLLVVSAGMGAYMAPLEMTEKRVEEMFRVNVFGRILAYRAAQKALLRSNGSVLFIGSTVAGVGAKGLSIYGACMGAMNGFVRSEARCLKNHGVRMNVLAPGWVETDMVADMREDYRKAAENWMPGGRFLDPGDVADQALKLASSDWSGEVVEYLG